jgi:hypothetical protein
MHFAGRRTPAAPLLCRVHGAAIFDVCCARAVDERKGTPGEATRLHGRSGFKQRQLTKSSVTWSCSHDVWDFVVPRELLSRAALLTPLGERGCQLRRVVMREEYDVAIRERFPSYQRGEPSRGRATPFELCGSRRCIARADDGEELLDLLEDLCRDLSCRQVGATASRASYREAAPATDQLAERVMAAHRLAPCRRSTKATIADLGCDAEAPMPAMPQPRRGPCSVAENEDAACRASPQAALASGPRARRDYRAS